MSFFDWLFYGYSWLFYAIQSVLYTIIKNKQSIEATSKNSKLRIWPVNGPNFDSLIRGDKFTNLLLLSIVEAARGLKRDVLVCWTKQYNPKVQKTPFGLQMEFFRRL